jgi:hypothetical protein
LVSPPPGLHDLDDPGAGRGIALHERAYLVLAGDLAPEKPAVAAGRRDGGRRRHDARADHISGGYGPGESHGKTVPVTEVASRRDADVQQLLRSLLHVGEQRLVVLLIERGDGVRACVETEVHVGVDQSRQDGSGAVVEARLVEAGVALDLLPRTDAGDQTVTYKDGSIRDDLAVRSG